MGDPAQLVMQSGDVIGVFKDAGFETTEVQLSPGDRFFMYTDGLIGEVRDQQLAMENLAEICQAKRDLPLSSMVKTVAEDMLARYGAYDDVVLVGVET